MTRRHLLFTTLSPAAANATAADKTIIVPVRHIFDARAKFKRDQIPFFWSTLWPEAVRDFGRCGVRLQSTRSVGDIRRSASGNPIISGLEMGVINMVLTNELPVNWDLGRGLTGVTTRYDGFHVCLIALSRAHAHTVPLIAINTCVHELLHVLLLDILEPRPKGMHGAAREWRIDQYATRLWLFHDGAAIRAAAEKYVERLRI